MRMSVILLLLPIALALVMAQVMPRAISGYVIGIGIPVIIIYSWLVLLVFYLFECLLRRWFSRWRWVLLVPPVLALLSLPWVEEAWIAWHFDKECQDAGVKIYRQVEVEGYARNDSYENTGRSSISTGPLFAQNPSQQADFEKDGFRFVEYLLADGSARHLEREGDRVVVSIRDKPEARYYYEHTYRKGKYSIEEPIGWQLHKIELRVVDSQTGEILGRKTTIRRVLSIHDALLAGLFGPPIKLCPSYKVPQPRFPQSILKPISTQ
jgi:hypothetical protein